MTASDAARTRNRFVAIFLATSLTCLSLADTATPGMRVIWEDGSQQCTFTFSGKSRSYPADVDPKMYPAPGAKLEIETTSKWPVVTLKAQWSISAADWPREYRDQALDLILMWACDAELYVHVYPNSILESKFTYPPAFISEARDPTHAKLAESMRGKKVGYEITGKGGFGASDYKIRTAIQVGASSDGKMIFYHDEPESISDHLQERDFVFMAYDTGDRIVFEIHAICICAPRYMFQNEALRRVKADGEYLIRTMYENLATAPSASDVTKYLEQVDDRRHKIAVKNTTP